MERDSGGGREREREKWKSVEKIKQMNSSDLHHFVCQCKQTRTVRMHHAFLALNNWNLHHSLSFKRANQLTSFQYTAHTHTHAATHSILWTKEEKKTQQNQMEGNEYTNLIRCEYKMHLWPWHYKHTSGVARASNRTRYLSCVCLCVPWLWSALQLWRPCRIAPIHNTHRRIHTHSLTLSGAEETEVDKKTVEIHICRSCCSLTFIRPSHSFIHSLTMPHHHIPYIVLYMAVDMDTAHIVYSIRWFWFRYLQRATLFSWPLDTLTLTHTHSVFFFISFWIMCSVVLCSHSADRTHRAPCRWLARVSLLPRV